MKRKIVLCTAILKVDTPLKTVDTLLYDVDKESEYMKLKKEERIQVGKKIFEKELSIDDVMEQYGVSRSCAEGWQTQYKRSAGILPGKDSSLTDYEGLSKGELYRELMKKDIEIERLKKGYTVKGVGVKKEYVTISDANTK